MLDRVMLFKRCPHGLCHAGAASVPTMQKDGGREDTRGVGWWRRGAGFDFTDRGEEYLPSSHAAKYTFVSSQRFIRWLQRMLPWHEWREA